MGTENVCTKFCSYESNHVRRFSQLSYNSALQQATTYPVTLRCMAFDDGQDVMKGYSSHLSIPQAHNITQNQPVGVLSQVTLDFEGL